MTIFTTQTTPETAAAPIQPDTVSLLDKLLLGNEPNDWMRAILIFVVVLALLVAARRVLISRLAVLARLTRTDVDDVIVELLGRTKFLFLLAVALAIASAALSKPESLENFIHAFVVAALFVQGVIWGNGIITFWVNRIAAKQSAADQGNIAIIRALGTFSRVVLFVALFLLALNSVVNVTPLIAGLGIGGIALALAVQNILGDLFGAVSILVDKPFAVGDFVVVDDLKGTIEHIGMKSTRVRSLGGEQIIFSNADLLRSRVRNFKRMLERRVMFTTAVTYQTPHETLARIPGMIREIVESQKPVRFERCHFLRYADSWLEYETIFWVLSPEYMVYADIQQAVNLEIYRRFVAEGIEFAYPTQTLVLERAAGNGAREGEGEGEAAPATGGEAEVLQ